MPALWTGSISFGLVTIPVSLVTAETREELDFTLLDRRDDWAVSLGGPVGIPKLKLFKDRWFFYTAYEKYNE